MPTAKPGRLRIHSIGGIRVTEVRDLLGSLEDAYNAIAYFEASIDSIRRAVREFGPVPFWPLVFPVGVAARGRLRIAPASWPPSSAEIASHVAIRDRLVLGAARLESPGFWDFIGKLNPLEVLRQYLVDRHERRKDRDYREAAERRRLDLENRVLENRVLKERIEIARQLGAADQDLTPLLNELVLRPLAQLDRYQDSGLVETAELVESEDEKSGR